MCGKTLTKIIKYSSIGLLVVSVVSAFPSGWPRAIAWAAVLAYVLVNYTRAGAYFKSFRASAAAMASGVGKSTPRVRIPRRIRIEGPPAAGKTTLLNSASVEAWKKTFGREVRFVPEEINQDALRIYNAPDRSNDYSFLFELYTRATRERDEDTCRSDAHCTYVFDRTLIGCFVFRVVNYTLGFLQRDHALQLFAERVLEKACEPISRSSMNDGILGNDDGLYDDVLVYCPTSYSLCRQWILKRDGADVKMKERYHKLTVFTYAYVVLQIAARYRNIGLLVNTHLPTEVPTVEEYDKGREQAILGALLNIDIVLTADEMARFTEGVGGRTPDSVMWFDVDGGVRCCSEPVIALQRESMAADGDDHDDKVPLSLAVKLSGRYQSTSAIGKKDAAASDSSGITKRHTRKQAE